MKKFLIATLLLPALNINAQITYQHTFPGPSSNTYAESTIINLGNNEYKYFYVDYASNQLKLFNLDFSPYSNLTVPITLVSPQSNWNGEINMFEYGIFPAS